METGKVEYAPDYKSEHPVQRDAGNLIQAAQRIWDESETAKERSRLEREVIEAAKIEHVAFRTFQTNTTTDNWLAACDTSDRRRDAVNRLIEFESSQQQIKK